MKFIKPLIAFSLLFCLHTASSQTDCYNLDGLNPNLIAGSSYGTNRGDTIARPNDLILTAEQYITELGEFEFEEIKTEQTRSHPDFYHGLGTVLSNKNINTRFHFSKDFDPVYFLQGHFYNYGKGINFAVNQQSPRYFSDFNSIPDLISPEIQFFVTEAIPSTPGSNEKAGVFTMISTEPISDFMIGGENLIIDNICLSRNPDAECIIYNPMIIPACDSDGNLTIQLYGSHTEGSSDLRVQISGNGNNYGDFILNNANDPIFIEKFQQFEPLPDVIEFNIEENSGRCAARFEVKKPSCKKDSCEIQNLVFDANFCDMNGEFWADLDFENLAPASDSFDLQISDSRFNLNLGRFSYADLPISVGPFSDTLLGVDKNRFEWQILVNDATEATCRAEITASDSVFCETNCIFNDLEITDISCVINPITSNFDSIRFSLNFDTTGVTYDSFQVFFGRESIGFFSYDDLPLKELSVENSGGEMKAITVSEVSIDMPQAFFCQTTKYFRTPCLECPADLKTTVISPPGLNGNYTVRFEMVVPASLGRFELLLDNILIDTFDYADIPLTLDFNCSDFADSTAVFVRGLGQTNCEVTSFYDVKCNTCDAPTYQATANNCIGTTYDLFIEFNRGAALPVDLDLYVNNILIGNYNSSADIVATGLTAVSTENLDIRICVVGIVGCCIEQTIPNPCFGFQPCDIQILNAETTDCDANGFFNIELDVEAVNSLGSNFVIFVNGDLQQTANYQPGVQSFNLGLFDGQTSDPFEILVFDLRDSNCTENLILASPNCNPNPCNISDIQANVTRCDGTVFSLSDFNFQFANTPSDSFQITIDNQPIGFYQYADLPFNLDNLTHDGDGMIDIRICDKDNASCCAELSLDFICDDCDITDFRAVGVDCDVDQQFFFLLNGSISTAQTNDSFDIRVNNILIEKIGNGDFAAFAGSGIQIGPFDGTGGITYEISIQSRALPNCRTAITSNFECPKPPCILSDLTLEAQPCVNNQTYLLDVDFQFANTRADSFFLLRNGIQFGKYAYANLPITIGPFFGNGSANMYAAFDSDEFNCRIEGSFISPNCPAPPCRIRDLNITTNACDVDGNFGINVRFMATNTVSNFFELYVNGTLHDTYRFSQLPITAGPFSGDGSAYEFQVKDAGDRDCFDETTLVAPNCPQPQCEIRDLNIGAFACDTDDNFDVEVDFIYQNTASANFELLINGFLFGTYAYADLPIIAQSLTGNGSTYTFTVRDVADFNCTDVASFISPDCTSDNCNISNFSATAGACDNDANFSISLDFDFQNMASDSFDLFTNGSLSGTYAYTDLPISAGMFPANGSIVGFAASDQVDATCTESTTTVSPNCTPVPCVFSNFLAEAGDCNASNEFMVDIDFDHSAASDSFTLFVNNRFYNTYAYSDLFITVGPFVGDGTTLNFEVRDLDDTNCNTAGSLTSPDCTPCELTDVFANTTDCDLNGQFFFEIDLDFANTSDSFRLNLLGNPYNRTFAYSDLPVLAGPFDGDGSTVHQFMIADQAEPNCNLNFSALAPNCICSIRDISAQASDCDAGNFDIELDFIFENTSDSFSVSSQSFAQNFAYADLPVTLGSFSGNGQTNTYLISDLVRTNCNEDFTITAPDCTPPCSLTNPSIIATDCDNQGNFTATINFDYSNTSSNFFNTNGYGIFAYADLPVTIGDFAGDGVTDYTVNITDGSDPDCSLPIIVPAKYCGDSCQIYNVQVSKSDCDNMGIFELFLEFDSENTNTNGFVITVNGQRFGPLPYSTPQPISLGTFFGDDQTSYNIFVFDAGDATCSGSAKMNPVNCLPCDLSDILTQITPCDNDGNFFVTLDFTAQSGSPLGFSITGNGNNYGSYSYSDLPISLPDTLAGDGTSVYEFVITDMDNIDCTISTTVGPVDCNTDKCRIFDITALPTDCNLNGEFSVELSFNYEDVGTSGFTVRGNGMIYGDDFEYDQLPIQIDDLSGDGITVYEFFIFDNENSDCNNFTTVGPIDCDDAACSIDSLQVEIIDCNGNGTYQVSIDFDYNNPTSTLFDVFTTRGLFGTYELSQLPLFIPDFPNNGNPFEAVRVCMDDDRLCCASTFFPTPDCDGDCIEFEKLPFDTTFIDSLNTFIGDTLLIENSVLMTTNVFLSATGAVLDSIAADSANVLFDAADGIQFTTHNATIDFQFPILNGSLCREVTFNYYQTGDANNISINGSPVQLFNRFEDLPFNIAPFVFVEVFPTNAREGVLKLKGFVNSVRLGGEEVAFDNICYGECLNLLSVWPGDINLDNWVSHLDILQFGVGYDAQGPARLDQTTNFEELPADDWLRYFGRGQNYKHADCNGDGLVDDADLGVMNGNYGEFHDMIRSFPIEPTQPSAPKLFIEYPAPADIQPGVPFIGKIILGEDINPVFNAYGVAFTLRYDKTKLSITDINYPPSWFGDESEDLRSIDQIFPGDGLAHIGISRINKENVTGSGAVAEFIGIIDDIVGRTGTIDIEIDGITAISKDEFPVPIGGSISGVDLSTSTIDLPEGVLNVYPNPTNDKVFFSLPENQTLDFVEVTSADGKVLEIIRPQANHLTLNHYTPGLYVLKFMIDGQPYYDRIIKQ